MTQLVTAETDLVGKYTGTYQELAARVHGDPKWLPDVVAVWYVELGEVFMLRADIMFAQARYETGDFTFNGQVPAKWNNPAGLRLKDGSGFYHFATVKDGITAHYSRMAYHVFENHVNAMCSPKFDPKGHGKHAFDIHTVGDMAIWAGGSPTYVAGIIRCCNE